MAFRVLSLSSSDSLANQRQPLLHNLAIKTVIPAEEHFVHLAVSGKDELHSHLSGVHCASAVQRTASGDFSCTLVDAHSAQHNHAYEFLDENHSHYGIFSPGWESSSSGSLLALKSFAAYKASSALLQHGRYDAVACSDNALLDAALRLSTEHALPLFLEPSQQRYAGGVAEGMSSRLRKSLDACNGIIVNDAAALSQILPLLDSNANPSLAADCFAAHSHAVALKEKLLLQSIALDRGVPLQERQAAASFAKKLSLQTTHSPHCVVSGSVAAISAPLDFNFSFDAKESKRRAKKLRSLSGSQLGSLDGKTFGAIASTPSSLLSFSRAFSLLSPKDNAIVFAPPDVETVARKLLEGTGLQSRVAFASSGDAGLMSATDVIVCPDGLSASKKAICAATSASLAGTAVFFGTAPLLYAASETGFGSSPAADAMLLQKSVEDKSFREKLRKASLHASQQSWSWRGHADAFSSFIAANVS